MAEELESCEAAWQAQQHQWQAQEQQLLADLRRLSEAEAAARQALQAAAGQALLQNPPPSDTTAWSSALGLDSDGEEENGKCGSLDRATVVPGSNLGASMQYVDASVQVHSGVEHDPHASSAGASGRQWSALLEAAGEEIQRLKDVNQRLIESRGEIEEAGSISNSKYEKGPETDVDSSILNSILKCRCS